MMENITEILNNLLNNLSFIFERLDWFSIIDILLVTLVFYVILLLLRDTQAMVLLRGGLLLIALVSILTSLEVLPAFSWLMGNALPALLLAIPVIFAPEIRRALERLGRTGSLIPSGRRMASIIENLDILVSAVWRLSARKHGALIVLQRLDSLQEFANTGVPMNAKVTPELLLQIFYPNTPLHDGAVIVSGDSLIAASCVMPLSTSDSLDTSPERPLGLRHRAALGISELGDAIAVVVSEETGNISVAHSGKLIRGLNDQRLVDILHTLYQPFEPRSFWSRLFHRRKKKPQEGD
jgi:diadenylate cyclase